MRYLELPSDDTSSEFDCAKTANLRTVLFILFIGDIDISYHVSIAANNAATREMM